MKAFITFAVCISVVLYAAISLSESDEICCTWINLKHIEGNFPQKIMFHYDGTYATYKEMVSSKTLSRGTFQITKKWSDSNGDIWYQIIKEDSNKGKQFQLTKVSQNGRKLEFVCSKENFPREINLKSDSYCNYIRSAIDY
ncbi:MAG: hypothetical protein PVG51_18245 [Desulfosarcina sp.]|jgi:hypothetical protein